MGRASSKGNEAKSKMKRPSVFVYRMIRDQTTPKVMALCFINIIKNTYTQILYEYSKFWLTLGFKVSRVIVDLHADWEWYATDITHSDMMESDQN